MSGELLSSEEPLAQLFDVALLDLDGTVYAGGRGIPRAAASVAAASHAGLRPLFVTNNASRTPQAVAAQLTSLGLAAAPDDVVTSAQAGARLVRERLEAGAAVLVVGGAGLVAAAQGEALDPVDSADAKPQAVLQGWSPDLGWALLAEGAYALATGVPWVATNTDRTLPTERGIAPGNGSFVALLAGVAGRQPDAVAGKPQRALLDLAVSRASATRPLAVGDRLDTDIEGANRAGLPSLLVLTGVSGPADVLLAPPVQRPHYVAADLTGLLARHRAPVADGESWSCGGWLASVDDGQLVITGDGADVVDALRAGCAASWQALDAGQTIDVAAATSLLGERLSRAASAGAGDP